MVVCLENASHFSSLKKKEFHKNVSRTLEISERCVRRKRRRNISTFRWEDFLMKWIDCETRDAIRSKAKRAKPRPFGLAACCQNFTVSSCEHFHSTAQLQLNLVNNVSCWLNEIIRQLHHAIENSDTTINVFLFHPTFCRVSSCWCSVKRRAPRMR